jgi:hypothetical protein
MPRLCNGVPSISISYHNERISQPCSDMHDKGGTILSTKILILAASMMALVTISGHACAGTTISDKRYWPSEAKQLSSQAVVRQPENALGSAMAQFTGTVGRGYYGGPKSNY